MKVSTGGPNFQNKARQHELKRAGHAFAQMKCPQVHMYGPHASATLNGSVSHLYEDDFSPEFAQITGTPENCPCPERRYGQPTVS
jgi:hypothetical protein